MARLAGSLAEGHRAAPRILVRFQLVNHSLAGETKILFFPPACRFLSAHRLAQLRRLFARLRLLRFHGFALPAACHAFIIVLDLPRPFTLAKPSKQPTARPDGIGSSAKRSSRKRSG